MHDMNRERVERECQEQITAMHEQVHRAKLDLRESRDELQRVSEDQMRLRHERTRYIADYVSWADDDGGIDVSIGGSVYSVSPVASIEHDQGGRETPHLLNAYFDVKLLDGRYTGDVVLTCNEGTVTVGVSGTLFTATAVPSPTLLLFDSTEPAKGINFYFKGEDDQTEVMWCG
ncbi:hypothetical protein AK812_SmicGene9137 [Symbiodinium microadriaticum]|uniref:Uncharacterized protein n=1 Tax=Symbiodinium microadriaticum TaxID=2951 RepID=A0A1Q9EJ51_SYMMI|nr:hypothetical protein AK812_SmicGene9137 [Symbiodinium microadriaticum]